MRADPAPCRAEAGAGRRYWTGTGPHLLQMAPFFRRRDVRDLSSLLTAAARHFPERSRTVAKLDRSSPLKASLPGLHRRSSTVIDDVQNAWTACLNSSSRRGSFSTTSAEETGSASVDAAGQRYGTTECTKFA